MDNCRINDRTQKQKQDVEYLKDQPTFNQIFNLLLEEIRSANDGDFYPSPPDDVGLALIPDSLPEFFCLQI